MSVGSSEPERPEVNSVITPSVVMRPILPLPVSVNQSAPSGPAAIALGSLPDVRPLVNSVITPSVVIRPMTAGLLPTNQRFPSGPAVMSHGSPGVRPTSNSVAKPPGDTRAIAPSPPASATQTLPSGPAVIPRGPLPSRAPGKSVTTADGVMRPKVLSTSWVNQRLPSAAGAMSQAPTFTRRPSLNSVTHGSDAVAVPLPKAATNAASPAQMPVRRRTCPVSTTERAAWNVRPL